MAKTRKKYSAEFKFKAVLRAIKGEEQEKIELFQQIGRLKMELEWTKKN